MSFATPDGNRGQRPSKKSGSMVPDHLKHRSGPVRATRYNEWYENTPQVRKTARDLSASRGGVPNNPMNVESFRPADDTVVRTNVYRDAEQVGTQEGPVRTKPDQTGGRFKPPHIRKEREGKIKPNKAQKGTRMAPGPLGSGPQRNVAPEPDGFEGFESFETPFF